MSKSCTAGGRYGGETSSRIQPGASGNAQGDADALRRSVESRRLYVRVKRVTDLASVLLASPAALITIGFCALVIVLLMGRPVFFVQDRVGRDGRVFRMVKLRTMRVRPRGECLATAKNDHRITPLGKFLRRSYLDELPQLWNIVQGDRTLIGPRPEQPDLVERYI